MGRTHNTIVLKSSDGATRHDEGVAGTATIKPGMAIELQADGKFDPTVTAQAGALKGGLKIACEDALQGKTIVDTYAEDDIVFWHDVQEGDEINLLVKSGENIVVGDKLVVEGGGSGLFVEAAGSETKLQFEALESTGGALGANGFVAARCLQP